MIDWVTAIIPCHHDEMIFGGFVTSVSIEGEIDWRVEKKQQIVGSHESSLSIKSLDNKHLFIDGNPLQWLQGHNIFGSDNLIGLYELKRVDCTAMWDLPRRGGGCKSLAKGC